MNRFRLNKSVEQHWAQLRTNFKLPTKPKIEACGENGCIYTTARRRRVLKATRDKREAETAIQLIDWRNEDAVLPGLIDIFQVLEIKSLAYIEEERVEPLELSAKALDIESVWHTPFGSKAMSLYHAMQFFGGLVGSGDSLTVEGYLRVLDEIRLWAPFLTEDALDLFEEGYVLVDLRPENLGYTTVKSLGRPQGTVVLFDFNLQELA